MAPSSKNGSKHRIKADQKIVIMNFSTPPSMEDIEGIAQAHLDNLPEELEEYCEELLLEVDELPDEALEADLDLDSPFDIFALYRSGAEISPGIVAKNSDDEDTLVLFRRPILDYWCETHDDLSGIIRQILISEIGQQFDFADEEIEEMTERSYEIDIESEYA